MGKVTYIEFNGSTHQLDVQPGQSVMEAAVGNMIPGIVGECGGACACATCHVFVDAEWAERVGAAPEMESSMLEVVDCRQPTSRLSCQIRMSAALDGLVVRMPETQC